MLYLSILFLFFGLILSSEALSTILLYLTNAHASYLSEAAQNSLFVLIFLGLSVYTYRKIKDPRKKTASKFASYVGYFLIFCGAVLATDVFFNPISLYDGIILAGIGLLLVRLYKKRVKLKKGTEEKAPLSQEKIKQPLPAQGENEVTLSDLFIQAMEEANRNHQMSFSSLLIKVSSLMDQLTDQGVHINAQIPAQMEKLLERYIDLADDPVKTEKTYAAMERIEEAFSTLYEALTNLYNKQIDSTTLDLETDMKAMQFKLRQDGLLESDLDKSMKNALNRDHQN